MDYLTTLERDFSAFLNSIDDNELKVEYLLPIYIGQLLADKQVTIKILPTNDKWFGITYKEDKDFVVGSFRKLIEEGIYSADLFSDLIK